jgi:hypothetical protein
MEDGKYFAMRSEELRSCACGAYQKSNIGGSDLAIPRPTGAPEWGQLPNDADAKHPSAPVISSINLLIPECANELRRICRHGKPSCNGLCSLNLFVSLATNGSWAGASAQWTSSPTP